MQWGISLEDIERISEEYDVRLPSIIAREVQKLQEVDGLLRKLDTAEAFNVAYVGSKPGSRNSRQLQNWRTKIINRLNKLVYGGARRTLWDTIGRKARRF